MGINSININIPDDILKERKTVEFKGEFSLEPKGNIQGTKITATFCGKNKKG